MDVRITQTDIARAAGVHNTTVSLALRNSPAIPEATRKRIQALAQRMGYHPDPALQALVAYRRGRTVRDRKQTIAYITNADTRFGWRSLPSEELFHAGAERKAAQLGYQLEHFWLGEPGLTSRRLSDILFHRGITGGLLASHRPDADGLLDFDWSRISAVKIGCFPPAPTLHRVMNDPHGILRLALKRTGAASYRRVGLVLPKAWDEAADRAWSTGFLIEQNRRRDGGGLPIHFCEMPAGADGAGVEPRVRAAEAERLKRWFDEFRPEAILSSWPVIGSLLAELDIPVGREVGFVDLFLNESGRALAGVRQNSERVGEVATEMLVSLMQQNICGEPQVPTTTLVEGVWCDGQSLPAPKGGVMVFDGAGCSAKTGERVKVRALSPMATATDSAHPMAGLPQMSGV